MQFAEVYAPASGYAQLQPSNDLIAPGFDLDMDIKIDAICYSDCPSCIIRSDIICRVLGTNGATFVSSDRLLCVVEERLQISSNCAPFCLGA
jgi:hypothetical protein